MAQIPILVALALVFLGFCYWGRAYWAWVVTAALALLWWRAGGVFSGAFFGVVVGLVAVAAVAFGVRPLRRALISGQLMKIIGRILPRMSDTEREALEAGSVWWDGQLFSGDPEWRQLIRTEARRLSSEERAFLDGPVEELCRRLDDHKVTTEGDLPPEIWQYIKDQGFMGMIIPREHGGLGLSARAQSIVIARLSSRCVTASVTVMVPNSLGPAELLLHYGTDEQKKHYLPRLASGEEVPCFALTEPPAGSDAASMRSVGIVCRGTYEGREVLGMRLNWDKRYITLAPIATVLGLAFKLRDPDHLLGEQEDYGITCALIPADVPGVELGERHDPLGVPFLNGPTYGKDVFVPIDCIIGGQAMAGKGWRMLMQSLSAGRGISLPSLSAGASELATRVVGAYATVREQFGLSIGRFEGIQAKLARIAGLTYVIDAAREMTLTAIDSGEKPSVVTAIMKAYSTEAMRTVVNDAMDVQAGAGICRGPRNTLAQAYQSVPIGITVEGANILTRSMIIFGQGAIRCHPWVTAEMDSVANKDVAAFDEAFFGHVNFVFSNVGRSFLLGLTGGGLVNSPVKGPALVWIQRLTRLSSSFALLSDAAMGTLGANLKRKENVTGRLADALAWLYLGSGVIKRFVDDGQPERDRAVFEWSMHTAVFEIQTAFKGLLDNLPNRPTAWALRPVVFPLGARAKPPSDRLATRVATALLDGGELRESLTPLVFVPADEDPGLGLLEAALRKIVASQPARAKLKDAQKRKVLPRKGGRELWRQAVELGVLDEEDYGLLEAAAQARDEAVQVDAFEPEKAYSAAF